MQHDDRVAQHIRDAGIIAIIRGDFPVARFHDVASALYDGGVSIVEITLNSTNALVGIERLRDEFATQLLVGAGTVRTVDDVRAAQTAGAQFLVSPNFDPASVAVSQQTGLVHLPGIFTATEAQMAFAAGCSIVKLFPADAFGPAYLKALRAPLDHIDFVPTGGINADNITDYVQVGAIAVGVGSSLVTNAAQDLGELTTRARQLVTAWQTAKVH